MRIAKKSASFIMEKKQNQPCKEQTLRTKLSNELYFNFSGESSLKIVDDYRAQYEAMSVLLDANPELLTLAHRDWARLLSTSAKGRKGYTSEQLLRALLVLFVEGESFRDTVIRIDTSEFLQYFVRLGVRRTMDYLFEQGVWCIVGGDPCQDESDGGPLRPAAGEDQSRPTADGHDGVRNEYSLPDGFVLIMG